MTAYNFFLKKCHSSSPESQVDRDQILKWNRDRDRIEWALRNVKFGDDVLLFQKGAANLLEVLLIANIVGMQGTLTLVGSGYSSGCFKENYNLYGMLEHDPFFESKIKIMSQVVGSKEYFSLFSVIIGGEQLLKKQSFKDLLTGEQSMRAFLFIESDKMLDSI